MIFTGSRALNDIIVLILMVELVILFVLLILVFLKKIFTFFKERKDAKDKQIITHTLLKNLMGTKDVDYIKVLKPYDSRIILLSQLESFDRRFNSNEWTSLKDDITKRYLLPRARKTVKSFDWLKRNFSARCFALTSLKEDKEDILKLVDDPTFLVRSIAAVGAVKIESRLGVDRVIHHMAYEPGYSSYFYRDVLLHSGSNQVLSWVEDIASSIDDQKIHLACLSVLSGKMFHISKPFLKQDLDSHDQRIRVAALKLYVHNPQKDSPEVLTRFLDDPDDVLRAEAALGMAYFATPENIKKLGNLLKDPSWMVRYYAARALKNMGKEGNDILNQQKPEIDKTAYVAAQYVLYFDW